VEGWNLLWSNEIYTCAVCRGCSGSPSDNTEAFVLNERFLVSALVKPNDLLIVKLDKLHRIWNNSNCLPKWQIVHESRMVSRLQFLTEFDLHLADLKFVPCVHNVGQMGLRYVDESLFPIIAPGLLGEVLGELQGSIPIVQIPQSHLMWVSKETNGLTYWQMRDRSLKLCYKTKLD
jgi:hypothetical protein